MITEKSERILKRAVAWLMTWQAFNDAGEDSGDCDEIINETLAEIDGWIVDECKEGRR